MNYLEKRTVITKPARLTIRLVLDLPKSINLQILRRQCCLDNEITDVCHLVVEVALQLAAEVADVHHIHRELLITFLLTLFSGKL